MTSRKKSVSTSECHIEIPQVSSSQINRQATSATSVYQKCLQLRIRLSKVENFIPFIKTGANSNDPLSNNDSSNPTPLPTPPISSNAVSQLWACFRLGSSLCFLYNQLGYDQLEISDNLDLSNQSICKKGVARFIMACKKLGDTERAESGGSKGWTTDDLFTVSDLYKTDTNGFIKVLHTVNLVLDRLESQGKLLDEPQPINSTTPTNGSPSLSNGFPNDLISPIDNSPHPFSHINTTNATRKKISQELIESERKFIMDMELLQSFADEIRNSNIFSHDTHHSIFTNLNALVDFQRRVQIGLEEAYEVDQSGGIGLWGRAFANYENDWLIYAPFVVNYKTANKYLLENAEFIQNGTPSGLSHYEVQALLIKPTQRVCKYHLLIDEIRKKTEPNSPSYEDLTIGFDAMKRVTGEINELQRQKENVEKVQILVERVEDWKGHTINQFGNLLIEDLFIVNKNHVDREYHVFLFEKIILCCKEIHEKSSNNGSDKGRERKSSKSNSILKKKDNSYVPIDPSRRNIPLQLKGRIYLNNVTHVIPYFRDIQPGSHNLEVWWRGDDDLESFTLRCRTGEQLELWKIALEKQLGVVAARRQALEEAAAKGEIHAGSSYNSRKQSTSSAGSHLSSTHPYARRPSGQSAWPQTPIETSLVSPMSHVSLEEKQSSPVYSRQQRAKTEDSTAQSFQQWRQQSNGVIYPPRSVSQQGLSAGAERALRSQGSKSALRQTPAGAPPVPSVSAAMAKAGSLATPPTISPHTRNRSMSSPNAYIHDDSSQFEHQQLHEIHHQSPMPYAPFSSTSMQTVSSNSSFVGYNQQPLIPPQPPYKDEEQISSSKGSLGNGSYSEYPTPGRSWVSKRFSESSTITTSSQDSTNTNNINKHSKINSKCPPISTSTSNSSSSASSPNGGTPPTPTNYVLPTSQQRNSDDSQIDKMKVKVRFNEDLFILNLPISINHHSLVNQVARKVKLCAGFSSHLPYSQNIIDGEDVTNFKLKWIDEEGDQILVLGDEDVGMAMDWAKNQGGGAVELIVS